MLGAAEVRAGVVGVAEAGAGVDGAAEVGASVVGVPLVAARVPALVSLRSLPVACDHIHVSRQT